MHTETLQANNSMLRSVQTILDKFLQHPISARIQNPFAILLVFPIGYDLGSFCINPRHPRLLGTSLDSRVNS